MEKKIKTKTTKVVKRVSIDGNEIIKIVNESLPTVLKEKFESSYSNPLRDAIDEAFKSDELKEELTSIVIDATKEIKKTKKFKDFVRESMINRVIDNLRQ
jgi:DNA mismatch repair ATPase MutL|tara:strand:- start:4994 stop:5293 length:300 start_codon:yes stop_codon:yes gene_type:complete